MVSPSKIIPSPLPSAPLTKEDSTLCKHDHDVFVKITYSWSHFRKSKGI